MTAESMFFLSAQGNFQGIIHKTSFNKLKKDSSYAIFVLKIKIKLEIIKD